MRLKTATLSTIATCIAFGAVPMTSEAKSSPNVAIDACVKSFVQTYLADRTVRQISTAPVVNPSPLSLFASREYLVVLSAHGADSGELIAEARCVSNRNGIVVVLDSQNVAHYRAKADFVLSMR
jgi:hypothetical protein